MIKVAYIHQSKININGLLSDLFPLMRGVRQGCPLALLLYIISAEALANFTGADKRIKGIQIGDHEIKIVNFADNFTIFLREITCLNTEYKCFLNHMRMYLQLVTKYLCQTTFSSIWGPFYAFHEMEIFHFVEIRSVFYLYLHSRLEFFN